MEIRLFAFDLDGTVLHKGKPISRRNAQTLQKAAEKGVVIVPATGRMRTFLPSSIASLPFIRYAVTSNGAVVYDYQERKAIYENMMPNRVALRCVDFMEPYHVFMEVYVNGEAYTSREMWEARISGYQFPADVIEFLNEKTYHLVEDLRSFICRPGVKIEKVNMPYVPADRYELILQACLKEPEIVAASSSIVNIELNYYTTSKADGLRGLGEVLGIPQEAMMTIGDNGNDLSMLSYAGFSAAVENATEEAKAAADVVVASCLEDGVAQAIEKYVL